MHLLAITRSLWTGKLLQMMQPMPEKATSTGRMLSTICITQWYLHWCIQRSIMHAISCNTKFSMAGHALLP